MQGANPDVASEDKNAVNTHYKDKKTALRNIQKGANFRNDRFQLFWSEKDVFLEASKHGFRLWQEVPGFGGIMGDEEKFADWFNDWCWDAEFVTKIALSQLDLDALVAPNLNWLNRYLPEAFTSSVEVLQKLLTMPRRFLELREHLTGTARIKYQEHLEMLVSEKDRFLIGLCEKNPEALRASLGASAELARSEFSYLPESLLADREFCFQLATQHEAWTGVILWRYQGDIDFVTDLYEAGIPVRFDLLSYEIRQLAKQEDPRTFLVAYRMRKRLNSNLGNQPEPKKNARLKI